MKGGVFTTMSKFLDKAIELALENVKEGGDPYGAVVVKDGEIIGEGVNTTHKYPDVSGHAELAAIREAQKHLNRIDLSDCTIYASGHPCPMCLGSIVFSGIKKVVYANSLEEAEKIGSTLSKDTYRYLAGDKEAVELSIDHVAIEDDELNPMLVWHRKQK